jgi:4-hydroxybenzoate polyprenyltransferase
VIGFKKIPALRNIPFVKLFVIGLIWGVSTFGLPFFLAGHTTYSSHNFLSLIAISGFVISQTIPFDIRDIHFDNKLHLKTLAQYLGLKKSKLLSTFGFLVLSVLFYQLAQQESTYNSSIILYSYSISSLMALSLIVGINANRKEIYFSGIIESILFFPFLIYLFWMNAI